MLVRCDTSGVEINQSYIIINPGQNRVCYQTGRLKKFCDHIVEHGEGISKEL